MALRTKDGHADKGVSLARFPALVIGSILLTFGLLAFLADGTSPTDGFPDGTVTEIETLFGIGVNDWTAFFTAAAGGLLLFGAAEHLLAKTTSLLVGLALGACSVIALIDGDDVLGLAGANGWTTLGWGIAAAALLINALLPRKGGKDHGHDKHREPAVAPRPAHRDTVAPATTTHRDTVAPGTTTHRDTDLAGRHDDLDRDATRTHPTATDRAPGTDRLDDGTARDGRFDRETEGRDGSVADDQVRRDDQLRR